MCTLFVTLPFTSLSSCWLWIIFLHLFCNVTLYSSILNLFTIWQFPILRLTSQLRDNLETHMKHITYVLLPRALYSTIDLRDTLRRLESYYIVHWSVLIYKHKPFHHMILSLVHIILNAHSLICFHPCSLASDTQSCNFHHPHFPISPLHAFPLQLSHCPQWQNLG